MEPSQHRQPASSRQVIVGLSFVLPAVIALVVSYLVPTLWTVRNAGVDDFRRVADDTIGAMGFALSLGILPLLTMAVFAPLLGYAAHRAGRPVRWAVRLVLAALLTCYAPAVFAAGWFLDRVRPEQVDDAGHAQSTARLFLWLTTIGVVCAVGVTLYLAVLRGHRRGEPVWPAALAVAGLAALAVVACALQVIVHPAVLTGRPDRAAATPVNDIFESASLGNQAARATLVGVVLGVLGIAAALVVISTGLRMDVHAPPAEPSGSGSVRRGPAVVAGAVLAVVVVAAGYGLWPGLSRVVGVGDATAGWPDGTVLVDTWLSPLLSTVVGVGLAGAAGFGIGSLRPLGRYSELLLLPFAPWLFVGEGTLAPAHAQSARNGGLVDTFAGVIPPVWIVVPALFVFTVLFRGHRPGWHPRVVWPMVALVAGATWWVRAQEVGWPAIAATYSDTVTGPMVVLGSFGGEAVGSDQYAGLFSEALPLGMLVLFAIGLGALQLWYLDRVAIRVDSWRDPALGRPVRPKRTYWHRQPAASSSDWPRSA